MKEIKTQTVYICPETGKKCRSKAEAERSAKAAVKAKEEAKLAAEQAKLIETSNLEKCDWLRLNLTDIESLPTLITQKAKEFWNIDLEVSIKVSFGSVSNSHGAPIGRKKNWSASDKNYPTSFPGWYGQIVGKVKNFQKKKNGCDSVSGLFFNPYSKTMGFRGFHTSSGCPGDLGGGYPMDIGFYFFLEDFPLLVAKYERFVQNQEIINLYNDKLWEMVDKAITLADNEKEVTDLDTQIEELTHKRGNLFKKFKENYISEHFEKPPVISDDYTSLQNMFVSNYNYRGKVNFHTPETVELVRL